MKNYYVYILSGNSGVLYIGVTNDLERRLYEHKAGQIQGFTSKYKASQLIYFEVTPDVNSALAREKQLKGWTRKKKVDLINTVNPKWEDISQGSFDFAQDDRGVSAVREQV